MPCTFCTGPGCRRAAQFAPAAQPDGDDLVLWLPGLGKLPAPSPEALDGGAPPLTAEPRLLALQQLGPPPELPEADLRSLYAVVTRAATGRFGLD